VPLSFELGEAFQFDWSEEGLVVGGIYYRMQVAHLKLCASRGPSGWWPTRARATRCCSMRTPAASRRWAASTPWHLRQHEDGGRQGQEGQGPRGQRALRSDVRALPVRPGLLQRRQRLGEGRVEKNVQDSRRRIWIEAARQRFGSFDELNAWLASAAGRCGRRSATRSTKQFSVAEMLEHELPHLMPMPEPFDGYVENPARVSSTCLVTVAAQPLLGAVRAGRAHGQHTAVPGAVVVVAGDKIVASHERLSDRGQTSYDWQHYIPLVQRKPGVLRNGAPFADMPEPLQLACSRRCCTRRAATG
jgi:hypothetical protein